MFLTLAVMVIVGTVTVAVGSAGGTGRRAKATSCDLWPGPGFGWKSKLVWDDEFDGKRGTAPSAARWTYDVGDGGFGNNELEYYTSSRANSRLDGAGHLEIIAGRQLLGRTPLHYWYTSARLKTLGLFEQEYGRFEIRMKIPAGQGLWPAFWMLGNTCVRLTERGLLVGWPNCGEIDVMEAIGKEDPDAVYGSIHGPGCTGACISNRYDPGTGKPLADDFHTYAVDWFPRSVSFYLDGHCYASDTPADMPKGSWVFNHPFYLLLNLAIGGVWAGPPNAKTHFPAKLIVDYVRVYKRVRGS